MPVDDLDEEVEGVMEGKVPWDGYRSTKKVPPLKAIRNKCLDCCNESYIEVEKCPVNDCPLYSYRFGKNPSRAGLGGTPPKGRPFKKSNRGLTDVLKNKKENR